MAQVDDFVIHTLTQACVSVETREYCYAGSLSEFHKNRSFILLVNPRNETFPKEISPTLDELNNYNFLNKSIPFSSQNNKLNYPFFISLKFLLLPGNVSRNITICKFTIPPRTFRLSSPPPPKKIIQEDRRKENLRLIDPPPVDCFISSVHDESIHRKREKEEGGRGGFS